MYHNIAPLNAIKLISFQPKSSGHLRPSESLAWRDRCVNMVFLRFCMNFRIFIFPMGSTGDCSIVSNSTSHFPTLNQVFKNSLFWHLQSEIKLTLVLAYYSKCDLYQKLRKKNIFKIFSDCSPVYEICTLLSPQRNLLETISACMPLTGCRNILYREPMSGHKLHPRQEYIYHRRVGV